MEKSTIKPSIKSAVGDVFFPCGNYVRCRVSLRDAVAMHQEILKGLKSGRCRGTSHIKAHHTSRNKQQKELFATGRVNTSNMLRCGSSAAYKHSGPVAFPTHAPLLVDWQIGWNERHPRIRRHLLMRLDS